MEPLTAAPPARGTHQPRRVGAAGDDPERPSPLPSAAQGREEADQEESPAPRSPVPTAALPLRGRPRTVRPGCPRPLGPGPARYLRGRPRCVERRARTYFLAGACVLRPAPASCFPAAPARPPLPGPAPPAPVAPHVLAGGGDAYGGRRCSRTPFATRGLRHRETRSRPAGVGAQPLSRPSAPAAAPERRPEAWSRHDSLPGAPLARRVCVRPRRCDPLQSVGAPWAFIRSFVHWFIRGPAGLGSTAPDVSGKRGDG